MTTFWIILGVVAIATAAYFYAIKTGKIEDADGDLIADEAEKVAAEVKRRAKNVKAELGDVKKAAKELVDQTEDVIEAVAGKPRAGRKPAKKATKSSGKGSGKGTGSKGTPKKRTGGSRGSKGAKK